MRNDLGCRGNFGSPGSTASAVGWPVYWLRDTRPVCSIFDGARCVDRVCITHRNDSTCDVVSVSLPGSMTHSRLRPLQGS